MLGFPDQGSPILFRVETLDGRFAPFGNDPKKHPRVCRIRNLLTSEQASPIAEIHDFNWHVFNAVAPTDGLRFVVEGAHFDGKKGQMKVKCFNSSTGEDLWTVLSTRTNGSYGMPVDATGRFLVLQTNTSPTSLLVEMSSGTITQSLPWLPSALGRAAGIFAIAGLPPYRDRGYSLLNHVAGTPLITLGIDTTVSNFTQFNSDGTQLAWGNTDGTVTVCNLREVHDRLKKGGLQWEQE